METLTLERGASSDHHKPIGTMLRLTFAKGKPKRMFYSCYKNFDHKRFEEKLLKKLLSVSDFKWLHFAFKIISNELARMRAPLKYKLVRNNNQPFIIKIFLELL